jgi:hypothetical protein
MYGARLYQVVLLFVSNFLNVGLIFSQRPQALEQPLFFPWQWKIHYESVFFI